VDAAELTRAMHGELQNGLDEIEASEGPSVVATDVVAGWGAAFRFHVTQGGIAFVESVAAARTPSGGWEMLGSSGAEYEWDLPWRAPTEGWNGNHVLVLMRGGLDVEDSDGRDLDLTTIVGFVSPDVRHLRVVRDGDERTLPVGSRVGAFAIVVPGHGPVEVIPMGDDRGAIGPATRFEG
jgi:hypothetical protein